MILNAPDRKKPLPEHVRFWSKRGYVLAHQDPFGNSAQLVKQKQFSMFWFLMWCLLFGVGGIIYLLYYWGKPEGVVLLQRYSDGTVRTIK